MLKQIAFLVVQYLYIVFCAVSAVYMVRWAGL